MLTFGAGANVVVMDPDFAGDTARLYTRYRRDLPAGQASALAAALGLRPDDVLIDLGSGTGQLGVPLLEHCAAVVAVDPEPEMLRGLRARCHRVTCVLGDDSDLPTLERQLAGPIGAVVIGNALHWMDEPATLQRCARLLRPQGAVVVITQGPPLWLGHAPWQVSVRTALHDAFGPTDAACGSDATALGDREAVMAGLGLQVSTLTWHATHAVEADWVVGHLGSALPAGAIHGDDPRGLAAALRAALQAHGPTLVEEVNTTAVIGRRTH